jgi:hypothetical protein
MTEVEVIGELVAVDSANKLVTDKNSTKESIADELHDGNTHPIAELFWFSRLWFFK